MTTLRALECLVALVEAGSITEAASRLHLSPSAVSHQLSGLERELGAPVVTRSPRGVAPTATGQAAAARARVAITAAHSAVDAGRRIAAGEQGRLVISCTETVIEGHLAPTLRRWHATRPQVHVELLERCCAAAVAEDVEVGCANLGISPPPKRAGTRPLATVGYETVMVVAAPGHRLTRSPYVPAGRLAEETLIAYDHLPDLLEATDLTQDARRDHPPRQTVRGARTAASLALLGVGVAVVPSSALLASHREHARPLAATPLLVAADDTIACPADRLPEPTRTASYPVVVQIGDADDPLARHFTGELHRHVHDRLPPAPTAS